MCSPIYAAFIPVRKRGKLPGECFSVEYEKEYGKVKVSTVRSSFCTYWWSIPRMCLRCNLELSYLVRTSWLSTTSLQRVNNMYALPTVLLTAFSRGFCKSRRRPYRQSGRKDRRIPLYHRNFLLERPFKARRTHLLDRRGRGMDQRMISSKRRNATARHHYIDLCLYMLLY